METSMKKKFPRKMIKLVCLLSFLTSPSLLSAQVTADGSMPFGQGQVVDLPGTTGYLGDIPHEITPVDDGAPYHTLAGLADEQPGWRDGIYAPGLNTAPVGIFFEDIPYPFASSAILNWMPSTGPFELLEFPAGAWWGPSASLGAVQLQSPSLTSAAESLGSVWGGTGGFEGGMGRYQDQTFSVTGNYQHGVLMGSNPFDTFTALSKMDWIKNDSFKLESGFLGSQWLSHDYWYSFFTSVRFDSPNFQSLQVKPFFQSAKLGGQDIQEMGARIQYQFNLAGLVESHLVGGGSRDYFSPGVGPANLNKEFIQNTETFDALGFINGDVAFRWDFSTDSKTLFSTLLGMQGNLGDFFLLGDYAKGVDASSLENTEQVDLGVRCQPDDSWNLSCQYVHEQMGAVLWDGARVKLQLEHDSPLFIVFKRMKFEVTEEPLQQQGGPWMNDVGGELQFGLFQGDKFWFKGRGLSGQPFYSEIGTGYSVSDHLGIFVSIANLNDLPTSWPDPLASEGRVFWFGIESKN
jgi:hypothetical protein